jgi:sigma-B regulation protein RsbU (phosphoserine phosphatase)
MLNRELAQAREIQLAWLPDNDDDPPNIDLFAVNAPASHISGDFYNWFQLPDGRTVVVIGDVTGHGMAAAFLMATTQLLVRTTMPRVLDPARCLEEINRQLCVQVFNGQFFTMLIAVLDVRNGTVDVATAWHPRPLVGGTRG